MRPSHRVCPASAALPRGHSPVPPARRPVGHGGLDFAVAARCPVPHHGCSTGRPARSVQSRLRNVLDACQLSQLDIARTAGIPYATVRRMAKPWAGRVALDHALKASLALGIPLEELFSLLEPTSASLPDDVPESSRR